MKIRRSRADFLLKLIIQRRALAASSKAFDDGEIWEAERLATTIFNLFVDKGRISSLLGKHLGILGDLKLISSCPPPWPPPGFEHLPPRIELTPANGFVVLQCKPEGQYFIPAFNSIAKERKGFQWVSFATWWEQPVFQTRGENRLTRSDLVWILRTKDGGSHIDEEISDPAYVALAEDAVPGMTLGSEPIRDIHLVVMRQIAWEVEVSLAAAEHLFA